MTNKQFNIRNLPELTAVQIDELCAKLGMTKTQLVIMAIDRLHQRELRPDITFTVSVKGENHTFNKQEDAERFIKNLKN